MWSDKNIALIMDTNIFEKKSNEQYDLSKLPLDKYDKIIHTIELNKLEDQVKIFFPEIVLLELLYHHKFRIEKQLSTLNQLNKSFENFSDIVIKGLDEFNMEEYFNILKDKYFTELDIIEIPRTKELMDKLIAMSLEKIPPFEKDKSDKGFKDAILLISVMEYARNNHFDKYVIFSKDKVFKKYENNIFQMFHKEVHGEQGFIKDFRGFEIIDSSNITEYIIKEFELFNDLKQYIFKDFLNFIQNEYDSVDFIEIDMCEYQIDFYELIKDDVFFSQLEENKFEVEFYLYIYYFSEEYYLFDEHEDKYVIQSESYIFENNNGKWVYSRDSKLYSTH